MHVPLHAMGVSVQELVLRASQATQSVALNTGVIEHSARQAMLGNSINRSHIQGYRLILFVLSFGPRMPCWT